MKIALLTNGIYPYVTGGMQKHSFYLAKFFAQNGIEVELYHAQKNYEYDIFQLEFFSDFEKKFITSHVLEFPQSKISFPGHYVLESWKYSKLIFKKLYWQLNEIDFIYAKSFTAWKLLLEREKGLKTPPIGINFHGYEMFQKFPSILQKLRSLPLQFAVKANIKRADYLFSYGGKVNEIIKKLDFNCQNIIEISTGIGEEWLNFSLNCDFSNLHKFVFVGRYERRKGIEELRQVLLELERKSLNLEFHFIGDIPESCRLQGGQYIYYGKLSNSSKVRLIFQDCDILVCPSYSEGMPNVILEGMASGLAIIATDVGAVSAMVSKQNGWLIQPGNKQQLRQAIIEATQIPKEDLIVKKESSQLLVRENFTWNKVAQQTIASIKRIIYKE